MFVSVAQANTAAIEQIYRTRSHWLDVQLASLLISGLNKGKILLHTEPPTHWQGMIGPMKGACVGVYLFEDQVKDEAQVQAILKQGEINFIPCCHANTIGPMGGIISVNMPMLVVGNMTNDSRVYCNLNEGIRKVMRFGTYGEDVLTCHHWTRNVLMSVPSAALRRMECDIDLMVMMTQGITMGDELHQRNATPFALLVHALAPQITRLDHGKQYTTEVMDFLSATGQFLFDLAVVYCETAMDASVIICTGSIIMAITRSDNIFGIRVGGLGECRFTVPINTPRSLFFTGLS